MFSYLSKFTQLGQELRKIFPTFITIIPLRGGFFERTSETVDKEVLTVEIFVKPYTELVRLASEEVCWKGVVKIYPIVRRLGKLKKNNFGALF